MYPKCLLGRRYNEIIWWDYQRFGKVVSFQKVTSTVSMLKAYSKPPPPRRIDDGVRTFSQTTHPTSITSPRPNFLIGGTAKSGTTSLYEYLRQHPQIFMPAENKEPHYFVHGYGIEGWKQYMAFFKDAAGKAAVGEASTWYLYCEESPKWIHAILGDIKIIFLLRNPAKRAFSLYVWMLREGYEDAETFAEALEREPARMADPSFRNRCPQFYPGYFYFNSGLYFEQIRRYLDVFGREQVKVCLFEDFVEQPEAVCRDICEFIGVSTDFTPQIDVHNEGRIPASIPLQYFLRTRADRFVRFLPRHARRRWIKRWMERNVRKGRKPVQDPQLLSMLTARYRKNIIQLEDLLGLDLSRWLKTATG